MARLPRFFVPDTPQHVIQRGNDRQPIFRTSADHAFFKSCLEFAARRHGVAIHAYVLMTNHVHLLATPEAATSLPRAMQSVGRVYVRYFNSTHGRSGTLWEGRYKATIVESDRYLLACMRYIELNPVRAGMVEAPGDYTWSSFRANGLGQPAKFWMPHDVYLQLGATVAERTAAYRGLFRGQLDSTMLNQIRQASNQGMALGSDRFRNEIERLARRRVVALKRGPKSKQVKTA